MKLFKWLQLVLSISHVLKNCERKASESRQIENHFSVCTKTNRFHMTSGRKKLRMRRLPCQIPCAKVQTVASSTSLQLSEIWPPSWVPPSLSLCISNVSWAVWLICLFFDLFFICTPSSSHHHDSWFKGMSRASSFPGSPYKTSPKFNISKKVWA